ncbi:MAG: 4-hydroxy-tetrahydrodipicolinate synthase [FCB group bacterium]
MKKIKLQGTITALVTPFKKDGSIDFASFDKLIDYQVENKIEGIVICGSTGESATLTLKEKMALIVHTVEYAAGRILVIAGTGSNETEQSLNMTHYAYEHGADAVLLVVPYYNKPTQDGLFEHFRLIAHSVDIPQILYNVPGRTGTNMLAETQVRIAEECPTVIGTKEASGNLEQMMQIIKHAPNHFNLLSGDDVLTIPIISIGGKGIISVIANYAPKDFGECVRLALRGKYSEAMKIHYQLFELMKLNFIESNPAPAKCALSLMGKIKDSIRLPLLPVSIENKKKIKEALIKAELL